jgi:methionyl-tRNA synthetase
VLSVLKQHYFDSANISQYLSDRYEIVGLLNAYIASTEPWKAIKVDQEGTIAQLQAVLFVIKYLGVMISPFLVEGTERLQSILWFDQKQWKELQTTTIFTESDVLEKILSFTESELVFGEWYIYS